MAEEKNTDVKDLSGEKTILSVKNLVKRFPIKNGVFGRSNASVHAVENVSFDLRRKETLAIVGESGCGKSTTANVMCGLQSPTSGHVYFKGMDVTKRTPELRKQIGRVVSVVFQDPATALNPRMIVKDQLMDPLLVHKVGTEQEREARINELVGLVGLPHSALRALPGQLSGGQRQRIGIARALAVNPKLVVLDEPVSALDVSVQAGVINLLEELRANLGLSYLMVAHDLAVIRHASDRVAVMYLGRIVEIGDVDQVFDNPIHPYTRALLSAIPVPDPEVEAKRHRIMLEGDLPTPVNAPKGCGFSSRCPVFKLLPEDKKRRCLEEMPELTHVEGQDHGYACYFPEAEAATV